MEFLRSARYLIWGTLKRIWLYLPPLLLDPFDIAERLFEVNYPPPQWLAWGLFALGWVIAVILTYHELRMQEVNSKRRVPQKVTPLEQVRAFISEGRSLQQYCMTQGMKPPEVVVANWVKRIQDYIEEHYGKKYTQIWEERLKRGRPSLGLTGMAIPQEQLWNKVTSGIEKLQEYEEELGESIESTLDREGSSTE